MLRNAVIGLLVWGAIGAGAGSARAAVRYVDAAAGGANDGTSWANAYVDLQSALEAAVGGDEIWVAAGIYRPGPAGDAVSSFVLREGVGLYGGFAGDESARGERDWATNVTVLSGDVGGDDELTPSGWLTNTANSGHVVVGSGVSAAAVLDGFVIEAGATGPAGTPAGDPLMYGSGLYIVDGTPTVRNCTFRRNLAAFAAGGAIYCQDAAPSVGNCRFEQNRVHLGNGAGIAAVGSAVPTVVDCVFSGNTVTAYSGNTGQGAALSINFLTAAAEATVVRCVFEYNTAQTFYPVGGIEIARGGGISNFGATLTVRDCVFRYNTANAGAAIQTWDPATIVNCVFYNNTVYSHDIGAGSDGGYGAGVCIYSFQPDMAKIINCTIVKNTGGEGVGVQSLGNARYEVRNSIIWANTANGQDVAPLDGQLRGDYSARYSCIQDLLTPIPGEDPPDPENYPGCIVVDPQLVNLAGGDLHAAAGSPCIDAGDNGFVPPGVSTDIEGRARFVDDPDTADTGAGTAPIVDMGAYEYGSAPSTCGCGDLDGSGAVDLSDFSLFAGCFGLSGAGAGCAAEVFGCADLDGSGTVDLSDFALFSSAFGLPAEGSPPNCG